MQRARERSDPGLEGDDEEQELRSGGPADDDARPRRWPRSRIAFAARSTTSGRQRTVGRPGERRDERRGQEAGEPEEADGDRAAGVVGGDEGRHEECPLAGDDREPGDASGREGPGRRASSGARRALGQCCRGGVPHRGSIVVPAVRRAERAAVFPGGRAARMLPRRDAIPARAGATGGGRIADDGPEARTAVEGPAPRRARSP